MTIQVSIFGSGGAELPHGWTKHTAVCIAGGGTIDATSTPGDGATLRLFTIAGGADIDVAPGTRVQQGGISVFGSSKNLVKGDPEQPLITIQIFSLFGGAKIRATARD